MQMPCELHNSIACYMQLHKVKRLKGSALPSHDLHLHFRITSILEGFSTSAASNPPSLWHPAKDHKDCHLENLCCVAKAPNTNIWGGGEMGKKGSMHSQCMSNASAKQNPNKTVTKPKHSTWPQTLETSPRPPIHRASFKARIPKCVPKNVHESAFLFRLLWPLV